MMLIKFCVFDSDKGVDEILRQLIVGHSLAVLDVDLAKDFSIAIENHTSRFHLLEFVQVKIGCLSFEIRDHNENVSGKGNAEGHDQREGNIKFRPRMPGATKTVARRRPQICRGRSQELENLRAKRLTLNAEHPASGSQRRHLNVNG